MKKYFYYVLFFLLNLQPPMAQAASIQPFVDLLSWKASESNSSWATTLTFPNSTTNVFQSSVKFNTNLGIKTGLSYLPETHFLDTKLYWTHFSTQSSNSILLGSQIVTSLFFSGSYFISGDLYFGGKMNWHLAMNMLDLEASHPFKPTPALTFTPKVGVKGGTIDQTININWDAILYTSTENVTHNFTGIGPSFGLDAKWNVYQNLNVIGSISTAFMYGKWNVKDTYKRPSALFGIITPTTISTTMNQAKLGTLMLDYILGLEYTNTSYPGQPSISVKLGYEMQYWANQLRLITIQQLPTLGDLTIEGATCGISIKF